MEEDEREKPFPCLICGKRFRTPRCLKWHGKVHQGDEAKVHQCPKCEMKFKTKGNRNLHLFHVHSDEKLQASEDSEVSADNDSSNQNKQVKCPDCDQTYPTPSLMYRHHRSEHGGVGLLRKKLGRKRGPRTSRAQYRCSLCGDTFVNIRSFNYHQGRVHRSTNFEINRLDGNETPQTQTSEGHDESFYRMEAIQGSSNSSSILPTDVSSDTICGRNTLLSNSVLEQQTGAQLPSAGPCFRKLGNTNSVLSYQRDFSYQTQEAGYPAPLSWHRYQALETGCVVIPDYAPLRPRELSLQLLQILQPPFQVHPHNTERYFSPSVRGRHASQISHYPQNIPPTVVTTTGIAGTNNGGDGMSEQISFPSSSNDLTSVPWEVVLKALQDFGKNSSSNGSK